MTRQEAISFINLRIQQLTLQEFDPSVWTDSTCELIKRIFPLSHENKVESLKKVSYTLSASRADNDFQARQRQRGISQAKQYLTEYINEINNHGLEITKSDENVVNHIEGSDNKIIALLKNSYFWGVLVIVIGATFTIGKEFGMARFDKEKQEWFNENQKVKKENESLKDTVKWLKNDIINLNDSLRQSMKK